MSAAAEGPAAVFVDAVLLYLQHLVLEFAAAWQVTQQWHFLVSVCDAQQLQWQLDHSPPKLLKRCKGDCLTVQQDLWP